YPPPPRALHSSPTRRSSDLRRTRLLASIDSLARRVESSDPVQSMSAFYQRATQMVLSPEARKAFDLSQEPDNVKELYGPKNDARSEEHTSELQSLRHLVCRL